MEEASAKSNPFKSLQSKIKTLSVQNDGLEQTNNFLEKKLSEMAKKLGSLEECRKRELKEMHQSREKYALMEREYEFYKDLAEKLET